MESNNLVAPRPTQASAAPSVPPPSVPPDGRSKKVFDLAIVGRGTAALEAARAAVRRHVRVVLIYQGVPASDTRIDPWLLSHALDQVKQEPIHGRPADRSASTAGAAAGSAAIGWLQRARQSVTPAADDVATADLARMGVEVLHGSAVFSGPDTLKSGDLEVQFRHAIVAPAATASPPELVLPEGETVLTAATLEGLAELPQRLAVFGSDPDSCQWAEIFRRLGCEVHLIDRFPTILAKEDPQIAAIVEAELRRSEIRLHLGCQDITIESMRQRSAIVIANADGKEKLLVDAMFWCGPRRLDTTGMGLAMAGIASTNQSIVIDDALRTTNPRIYVAGEGCGSRYDGPLAAQTTARVAVANAIGPLGRLFPRRLDWRLIPRALYGHPEIVQVGWTHHEIAAARGQLDTYRQVLGADAGAGEDGVWREFVEVVVDRPSGRIAAATAVVERADEWLAPLELLLARRLTLAALADVIPCRPSRLEMLKRIAERYLADREARYGRGWCGEGRARWDGCVRWCKRAIARH